jgi:glycosyltransferase involved in cell wall biosynthesis
MPVHNPGDHLVPALNALLSQQEQDFELLISDNASDDGTEEICRDYARRDPRVQYVRQVSNIGPGRNFLAVLERARAPYFMFAAHDDRWEHSFASKILEALRGRSDAVLGFCYFDAVNHATGEVRSAFRCDFSDADAYPRCVSYLRTPVSNIIYGIFRREVLLRTAWRQCDQFDFSDVFLGVEAFTLGSVVIVPEVLFHAGVCGVVRPDKSFARSRHRNFRYGYAEYYRRTARLLWRSPAFTMTERCRLEALLAGQVLSMIQSHEADRMSRVGAAMLALGVRVGRRVFSPAVTRS